MIRYYINNFTDGYNQDCLDFCQKRLIQNEVRSRGALTPMKTALIVIMGVLTAAWFYIPTLFPLPE